MSHLEKCAWKIVNPSEFTMGVVAERCGKDAAIKVLRPHRKKDLYLCEYHMNTFIDTWSLHYHIELLHQECDCSEVQFDPEGLDEL